LPKIRQLFTKNSHSDCIGLVHFFYAITPYAVTGRAKKFRGSISCPLIEHMPRCRWSANPAVAAGKPQSAGKSSGHALAILS
jgi:hypothetical protein